MRRGVSIVASLAAAWAVCMPGAKAEPFRLSPPKNDGPVVVRADFELRDITDIDDGGETFELNGVLSLTWRDPQRAFDPAEVGVDEKVYQGDYQVQELSDGWFPQVVLVNESGQVEKRGLMLRVQADGTSTLTEALNAVVAAKFNLRRYPFDDQHLEAVFEVLGTDNTEVVFRTASDTVASIEGGVHAPQWTLTGFAASVADRTKSFGGRRGVASTLVVRVDVERGSFFMMRLVVIPLILIVILSWSVFWMERSLLADRISVSFIGILTAVAYQILVSEIQPHISYMTLMHGFLNLSMLIMCATVAVNLRVGRLDAKGQVEAGDRVDRRCRWLFPVVYFGFNGLMVAVAFAFF